MCSVYTGRKLVVGHAQPFHVHFVEARRRSGKSSVAGGGDVAVGLCYTVERLTWDTYSAHVFFASKEDPNLIGQCPFIYRRLARIRSPAVRVFTGSDQFAHQHLSIVCVF